MGSKEGGSGIENGSSYPLDGFLKVRPNESFCTLEARKRNGWIEMSFRMFDNRGQ